MTLPLISALYDSGKGAPDAQSTLEMQRTDLQKAISVFLNMGFAVPTDTNDLYLVNESISSGLRQFYWPEPVLGESRSHEWSFLFPVRTFSTMAKGDAYALPADVGGIRGNLTFSGSNLYSKVIMRGPDFIEERRSVPASVATGVPRYAALRAIHHDETAGQRYELILYPTPDAAYSLTYRYNLIPQDLSNTGVRPAGAAVHTETIFQSCREAAERIANQNSGGPEHVLFLKRLTASVLLDRQLTAPEFLGDMRDPGQFGSSPRPSFMGIPDLYLNGTLV